MLAGHSWGGTIAVHAAADRPSSVAALVLLDSGHLDYADVPGSNPEAMLTDRIEQARTQVAESPSFDALVDELRSEIARPVTSGLLEALRAGVRERPDGSVEPIVTPEVRAAAMQGAVAERPSESWPVLADAGAVDRDDVKAACGKHVGDLADPGAARDGAERVPEDERPPVHGTPRARRQRRPGDLHHLRVA